MATRKWSLVSYISRVLPYFSSVAMIWRKGKKCSHERKGKKCSHERKGKMSGRLPEPVTKAIFPDDVFFEILSRLPARNVGRFRCVCKSWQSMTTSHAFTLAHAKRGGDVYLSIVYQSAAPNHYLISTADHCDRHPGITMNKLPTFKNLKGKNIESSCDGLACTSVNSSNKYNIINILTGHSVDLPMLEDPTDKVKVHLYIYFHPFTCTYRVLQVVLKDPKLAYVLAIGEKSWRRISSGCPRSYRHRSFKEVNGMLYWLTTKDHIFPTAAVMRFDEETEVFSLLPQQLPEKAGGYTSNLLNCYGELGYVMNGHDGIIDVWSFNSDWSKRYSILCDASYGIGKAISVHNQELHIPVLTGPAGEKLFVNKYDFQSFKYKESLIDPRQFYLEAAS